MTFFICSWHLAFTKDISKNSRRYLRSHRKLAMLVSELELVWAHACVECSVLITHAWPRSKPKFLKIYIPAKVRRWRFQKSQCFLCTPWPVAFILFKVSVFVIISAIVSFSNGRPCRERYMVSSTKHKLLNFVIRRCHTMLLYGPAFLSFLDLLS